jgi:hypothetical protein
MLEEREEEDNAMQHDVKRHNEKKTNDNREGGKKSTGC